MRATTDAQAWLENYRRRIDEIGGRARRAGELLDGAQATVTSHDGAVTVTVTPGGELRALVLHDAAGRLSRIRLAETITATVGAARAQASREAAQILAPLLGRRAAGLAGTFTAGNAR